MSRTRTRFPKRLFLAWLSFASAVSCGQEDDGQAATVFAESSSPIALVADEEGVYWADNGDNRIYFQRHDADEPEILWQDEECSPLNLAIAGRHLYWMCNGGIVGSEDTDGFFDWRYEILELDLDGESAAAIIIDITAVSGWVGDLLVDPENGFVYWTQGAAYHLALYRAPLEGGAIEKLDEDVEWSLTMDAEAVYFIRNEEDDQGLWLPREISRVSRADGTVSVFEERPCYELTATESALLCDLLVIDKESKEILYDMGDDTGFTTPILTEAAGVGDEFYVTVDDCSMAGNYLLSYSLTDNAFEVLEKELDAPGEIASAAGRIYWIDEDLDRLMVRE